MCMHANCQPQFQPGSPGTLNAGLNSLVVLAWQSPALFSCFGRLPGAARSLLISGLQPLPLLDGVSLVASLLTCLGCHLACILSRCWSSASFSFCEGSLREGICTAGSWWWRLNWSNIDVLIVVDALVIFGYWIEDPFFSFSLPSPSPSSPFISLLSFVSWALCKGKKHNNNSNKVDVFLCCHSVKAMFPI